MKPLISFKEAIGQKLVGADSNHDEIILNFENGHIRLIIDHDYEGVPLILPSKATMDECRYLGVYAGLYTEEELKDYQRKQKEEKEKEDEELQKQIYFKLRRKFGDLPEPKPTTIKQMQDRMGLI